MNQPPPQYPAPAPQFGQYQPPAGYELKKKKSRKWPWVLGAILLLLVIGSAMGGNNAQPGSTATPAQAAVPAAGSSSTGGNTSASSAQGGGGITYEVVSGNGKGTALITYTAKGFNQSQENGAKLPWRKTIDLGDGIFSGGSLVAQAGQGVNSITCRVKDGNEVISENTSTGQYAVVTCSGN